MLDRLKINPRTLLKTGTALAALISILLALPLACGDQESENGLASVSVGFTPRQYDSGLGDVFNRFQDAYNPYPSVISEMVVTVTFRDRGLPARTIRKKVSGADISGSTRVFVEVPPGLDRTIRIEAFDRGGQVMFSGETTVDLAENQALNRVEVELAFQCRGTAWDAVGDTLPRLAKKIGFDNLGLGFLADQIDLDLTEEYDLLSLVVEKTLAGIRINAEFKNTLGAGNFSGVVLLDTDNNSSTPGNGNVISQILPSLGADFIVLIQPGEEASLVDLRSYTGTIFGLPEAGTPVSAVDVRSRHATIDISEDLIGNITGSIGFFGIFGSNGIPTDLAPDWGICLSEPSGQAIFAER